MTISQRTSKAPRMMLLWLGLRKHITMATCAKH
jgi:hypothetical protein